MASIIKILNSANFLVSHRQSLDFDGARRHVKKLLIEGVKVGVGIGGFFAILRLMARQNSLPFAACVGTAAIGGSLLLTSRVSVILYDATKITAGLVFFKIGCLDFLVFPAVASVKAISFSMPRPIDVLFTVGKGWGRLFVGVFSLIASIYLMDIPRKSSAKKISDDDEGIPKVASKPEKTLIDRQISRVVKKAAAIVTKMLGYRAPSGDTRNLKVESQWLEERRNESSDGSSSE